MTVLAVRFLFRLGYMYHAGIDGLFLGLLPITHVQHVHSSRWLLSQTGSYIYFTSYNRCGD